MHKKLRATVGPNALENRLRLFNVRRETVNTLLGHLTQQRLVSRECFEKTDGIDRVFCAQKLRDARLI